MTLRGLLLILFLMVLAATFGTTLAVLILAPAELARILPPSVLDPAMLLVAAQAMIISAVLTVALGVAYSALSAKVVAPLRCIIRSMDAFAQSGTRADLSALQGSIAELRSLGDAFVRFSDRVETAHTHDVEVSRVKSDFISTAAHQLRTPLTAIRWALEALEKSDLPPDQKALVVSATEKSHDLVTIVGTLLDISAIESGKYKYDFKPVNMAQLLAGITQDFAPLSASAKVTLYFEQGTQACPPVRADKERIKWVLNNLIENAVRYTPEGGSVRITLEEHAGMLYVRVRDTGIGIAKEDRGNIFERFYRAPNAIAKQNGGNGLGLYIARTIATDHGGDLDFAANEGAPGTTFTLTLPVAAS